MIVRFRRGNMTETRPVHGKLDHHVSAARKRDGYKQIPVSVEFTKYGNTLFRPVLSITFFYKLVIYYRRNIIYTFYLFGGKTERNEVSKREH